MYIIEGNIGSGKSTFLKILKSHIPGITTEFEPISSWKTTDYGQELLEKFYQHPKRWAYTLESLTMMNRVRDYQTHHQTKNPNIFTERSIYSGHHCFAQNSHASGFMTTIEWQMYSQLFSFLILNTCKAPLGFIYLKVDPAIAYERIQKRNRPEENNITRTYIDQIHERHESFLINEKNVLPHIGITPVLTLDCDEEFESNPIKLHEHITKVKQFIASTQNKFIAAKPDWQMLRRAPTIDDELYNI